MKRGGKDKFVFDPLPFFCVSIFLNGGFNRGLNGGFELVVLCMWFILLLWTGVRESK